MAEADLITLLMGRAVRFSIESPESSRWRALRTARSLMALAMAPSASCGVPLLGFCSQVHSTCRQKETGS